MKYALRSWGNTKFGKCEADLKVYKDETRKWGLEAEKRLLNDEEREKWKESRREWVQKENWRTQIL